VESVNFNEQTGSVKSNETNNEFAAEYTKLLISSGAGSVYRAWRGRQLSGIHRLGPIPAATESSIDSDEDINNVTMMAAGYIGWEAAENIFELGKKVTLIQRGDQVANIFDADMAEIIHNKAEEKGINLILNEEVTGFIGDHYVEKVQTNKN